MSGLLVSENELEDKHAVIEHETEFTQGNEILTENEKVTEAVKEEKNLIQMEQESSCAVKGYAMSAVEFENWFDNIFPSSPIAEPGNSEDIVDVELKHVILQPSKFASDVWETFDSINDDSQFDLFCTVPPKLTPSGDFILPCSTSTQSTDDFKYSRQLQSQTGHLANNCQNADNVMVPDYAEALKLNKQLTDALKRLLIELEDQQFVILEKQRVLRAEIEFLKANRTRKDVKVKKINFSQFGYPYFKDKDGEALPVYDEALVLNKILGFKPIYECHKTVKMNYNEESELEEAVMQELVRIALIHLANEKEVLKKVLAEKMAEGKSHKSETVRLEKIEKRIKDADVEKRKWFNYPYVYNLDLINWKEIAKETFPRKLNFNGPYLRQWWQSSLDPSIQRGPLNSKELTVLQSLTKDCIPEEGIDFKVIATKLAEGTKNKKKRSWFQLGQFYQRNLNLKNRIFGWTKEEEDRLVKIYHKYTYMNCKIHKKNHVEWNRICPHFPGRTLSQLETYIRRLFATSTPLRVKPVATPTKQRGRPIRAENLTLDLKIAELSSPYKCIRQGRRRLTSHVGDGRVNGIILSSIHQLLPDLNLDLQGVSSETEDLIAAGVAERDVRAVETLINLQNASPLDAFPSEFEFPRNLASLTGLRGLLLMEEAAEKAGFVEVEVEVDHDISQTEVDDICKFGDPASDHQLLLIVQRFFGWAKPFLSSTEL